MRKKFTLVIKKVVLVMICFSFICTTCFSHVSFATSTDGMVIREDTYYIQNKETSLYMSSFDYCSIVQNRMVDVMDLDMLKWEVSYSDNGYYRIKNCYSGYYLTAPGNNVSGNTINEQISFNYTNSGQLWTFELLESGQFAENKHVKIKAKSHLDTALVMASSNYMTMYGYAVVQDTYVLDTTFYDEWILIPTDEAFLAHVPEELDSSGLENLYSLLSNNGYSAGFYYGYVSSVEDLSKPDLLREMEDSSIFVILAHGAQGDMVGQWVRLDPNAGEVLSVEDIYDFDEQAGIDLSDSEVVVFLGCKTANHTATIQNLPTAAVFAGAPYSIGFTENINIEEANIWVEYCFELYLNGDNIEDAAYEAAYALVDDENVPTSGIGSIIVINR